MPNVIAAANRRYRHNVYIQLVESNTIITTTYIVDSTSNTAFTSSDIDTIIAGNPVASTGIYDNAPITEPIKFIKSGSDYYGQGLITNDTYDNAYVSISLVDVVTTL